MMPTQLSMLEEVLPEELLEQLAELILRRMLHGWGVLEIEFQAGRIKEFRETAKTPARRGADEPKGG